MTPSQNKLLLKHGDAIMGALYEAFMIIRFHGPDIDQSKTRALLQKFGVICKGEKSAKRKRVNGKVSGRVATRKS